MDAATCFYPPDNPAEAVYAQANQAGKTVSEFSANPVAARVRPTRSDSRKTEILLGRWHGGPLGRPEAVPRDDREAW
jgi:hypothetical protein